MSMTPPPPAPNAVPEHVAAPPAPSAPPAAPAAVIVGDKSTGVAYLLWFFLGALGAHKFYLGRIGMGIAYIFTLGFLGIGLLIDLFTLPKQTREANLLSRAQKGI